MLIADDDASILRLVQTVVEGEGFTVSAANDGKEAYKILRSGVSISDASVDVRMPYIEGTDLVRFMQSDKRLQKCRVILMIGERSPSKSAASLGSGAVAFFPKPSAEERLRTILRTSRHRTGRND